MKSQNKHYIRNNFINSVINRKDGRLNQKYFSPVTKPNEIGPSLNIVKTKTNMRELSRFSDRPYLETPRILANNVNESSNSYLENNYSILNENNGSYMRNNNNNLNNVNYFNYSSSNNNRRNNQSKKKIVIFTECPKKLSDYILKNNNKKKVYQLNYIDENDFYSGRYYNNKIYRNYYSNENEYNNINSHNNQKRILNFKTYNQNYNNDFSLLKQLYNNKIRKKKNYNNINENLYINNNNLNNNINNNTNSDNYSINDIYTNNQNNDELKVIKIQSVWRSFFFRRYLLSSLNNFYNFVKLSNVLHPIFYNNSKPIFKQFLINLRNNLKEKGNQNPLYKKAMLKSTKARTKVIDDLSKKSFKQLNQIAKNNINLYTRGKRKNNIPQNNCIYRKKNELTKSPLSGNERKFNKNNFNLRAKPKTQEPEKKEYKDKDKEKDKSETNINSMIKLITKKVYLLHFPLLLYRLRILEKIKLIEIKFQRLYRLLCIKKKLLILPYFRKYRMNILSQTINNLVSENKINKKINIALDDKYIASNDNKESQNYKDNTDNKYLRSKNKLNNANNNKVILNNINLKNVTKNKDILLRNGNKKINNIINDKVNNSTSEKIKDNINNNIDNDNDKISNNINEIINYNIDVINIENNNNYISKENVIDNNFDNKKEILNKIINKKELKIKTNLKNYFNKWKDISKDIYVLPKLQSNDVASIKINTYKSTALPYRKHIKVKKKRSNNLSHNKSNNIIKTGINSFQSDSGAKKMKINIVNVFTDSNEKESNILKMFSLQSKNSIESAENSNFIKKIADITRKISRKNLIFKYFNYWNKKAKEN